MNDVTPPADGDPVETREWLESIDSVLRAEGPERAHYPDRAADRPHAPLRRLSAVSAQYRLRQYDSVGQQPEYPGDRALERRIEAYHPLERHGDGGAGQSQIDANTAATSASYASSATLYEVGLQSFLARAEPTSIRAIWSTSRAIPRPASTRAPISKAA